MATPEEIITVPIGSVIGQLIGGGIGYFSGSTVAEAGYDWGIDSWLSVAYPMTI